MTVRNSAAGIDANGVWVDVADCRFVGGSQGVTGVVSGMTTVRDSHFEDHEDAGVMVFEVRGATGALVENCTFLGNGYGIDFQPANCIVRDSSFDGDNGKGAVGVQVSFGGAGLIERCTFRAIRNVGVGATGGSQIHMYDWRIRAGHRQQCVDRRAAGRIPKSPWRWLVGDLGIHEALHHRLPRESHTQCRRVLSTRRFLGPNPSSISDLSDNYWGMTSTEQLDEWIHDHYDNPTRWFAVVDYLPLADEPIPTDESSIGRLKTRVLGALIPLRNSRGLRGTHGDWREWRTGHRLHSHGCCLPAFLSGDAVHLVATEW